MDCEVERFASRFVLPIFRPLLGRRRYRSPSDITNELWLAADEMFCHRLPANHLPIRLIGMGVSGFDATGLVQGLLFDQDERKTHSNLDAATDQIRERFGLEALRRASSLHDRNDKPE